MQPVVCRFLYLLHRNYTADPSLVHIFTHREKEQAASLVLDSPTCLRLMRCIIIIVKTVDLWKAAARRLLLDKKYRREYYTTKVHLDTVRRGRVKLKHCLQEFSQI
jgi:hypothetical protein